jgi:hypothetical protein
LPRPSASFLFPSRLTQPIKAINRRLQSPAVFPSLYSLHAQTICRPSMASRRPPRPLISPLPPSLFKAELELLLTPFAPASHLHMRPRTNFTRAAASASRRRWRSSPPVKGSPFHLFSIFHVLRPPLIEHPLHQDPVLVVLGTSALVRRSAARARRRHRTQPTLHPHRPSTRP